MAKTEVDIIVEARYLLPMTDTDVISDAAMAVKDGLIVEVGKKEDILSRYEPNNLLGGNNRAVLPGFVNTHTHAAMVYFRGLADDLPLKQWLEEHIWPAESRMLSPEFCRDATELACLEMISSGVTLFNDMYFYEDASAEAIKKAGLRAVLGAGVLDFPTSIAQSTDEYIEKAEQFIKDWIGDELIMPSISPHAPYTCSPETYKKTIDISERYSIPVHTHLSETAWEVQEIKNRYGKTPIEHLESHGLLTERMIAAHVVWPTDREIEILAERGVSVSHCPESNLKLASGISPVYRMLKKGVHVSFGTDGAASNNDLDVLGEASLASKLQKAVAEDPTVLDAKTTLRMATCLGAKALGLSDITGTLEKGKSADFIVIDLDKPHLMPIYDIFSHIVYSARASDVCAVVVKGRVLMNDYEFKTLDKEEVFGKAKRWAMKIMEGQRV